jgi:hypothetical protein
MNRAERICASVAAGGVVFTTIHKFFPEDRGDRHPTLSLRTIARVMVVTMSRLTLCCARTCARKRTAAHGGIGELIFQGHSNARRRGVSQTAGRFAAPSHLQCDRTASDTALARVLGAFFHVSGSIDDLQIRDAPEGQQRRPRSVAIVAPDLEEGNVVIDLGILEQPFAGCETAALLKNLQMPDMIARRNA